MTWKIAVLAMLAIAVESFATPVCADTRVKVTVLAPDGGPAAGVAVTIRPAAGYGADNVGPPAIVAAGATGRDGTANLRLEDARSYDVYGIGADDTASGSSASTVVFAGEDRWPATILTLGDPASAINQERVAARTAAANCDQAAYSAHLLNTREAIVRREKSLAALENAIGQYARASDLAAASLDAARTQLAAVQQQPGTADRVATLQHYVLLRLLADNMRAGLEADRASAQSIATLQLCSNEGKAGVQMLPRCPPGWQTRLQTAQSDSNCHQRPSGTGREQN